MLDSPLTFIVPPQINYNGLSLGNWSALWWNWLFSNQEQIGSVWFLRGNVDRESNVIRTGRNRIILYSDKAIFFPVICTITSKLMFPEKTNEMDMRKESTEPERHPTFLRATVDGFEIPDLQQHYAESPQFILEVSRGCKLRKFFCPPLLEGRSEAVSAGYWVLIRPLPEGNHRIVFEGKHKDGFKTSGDYSLKIIPQP